MANSSGKVAIVTGAAGGIGAAVSERLARDGFTVIVNYAGRTEPAEALAARIEAAGGRAVAARADISDAAAVARLFDTAEAAFGGVDVLVNNAGVMRLAAIGESDDALFDRQIAVNLKGNFNTLREASRRLRDSLWMTPFPRSALPLMVDAFQALPRGRGTLRAFRSAAMVRGENPAAYLRKISTSTSASAGTISRRPLIGSPAASNSRRTA